MSCPNGTNTLGNGSTSIKDCLASKASCAQNQSVVAWCHLPASSEAVILRPIVEVTLKQLLSQWGGTLPELDGTKISRVGTWYQHDDDAQPTFVRTSTQQESLSHPVGYIHFNKLHKQYLKMGAADAKFESGGGFTLVMTIRTFLLGASDATRLFAWKGPSDQSYNNNRLEIVYDGTSQWWFKVWNDNTDTAASAACDIGFSMPQNEWATYSVRYVASTNKLSIHKATGATASLLNEGTCSAVHDRVFGEVSGVDGGVLGHGWADNDKYAHMDVAGIGLYIGILSDAQVRERAEEYFSLGDALFVGDSVIMSLLMSDLVTQSRMTQWAAVTNHSRDSSSGQPVYFHKSSPGNGVFPKTNEVKLGWDAEDPSSAEPQRSFLNLTRATSESLSFGALSFDIGSNLGDGGFTAIVAFRYTADAVSFERLFDFGAGENNDNIRLSRADVSTDGPDAYEFTVTSGEPFAAGGFACTARIGGISKQNTWTTVAVRYHHSTGSLDWMTVETPGLVQCAPGFYLLYGTTSSSSLFTVSSCSECARECSNLETSCRSYQCSPSTLSCRHHAQDQPDTASTNDGDFAFCSKKTAVRCSDQGSSAGNDRNALSPAGRFARTTYDMIKTYVGKSCSSKILSAAACEQVAFDLGKSPASTATTGWSFMGDYDVKGCYGYISGSQSPYLYYGTIGGQELTSEDQLNEPVGEFSDRYRPLNCGDRATVPTAFEGHVKGIHMSAKYLPDRVVQGIAFDMWDREAVVAHSTTAYAQPGVCPDLARSCSSLAFINATHDLAALSVSSPNVEQPLARDWAATWKCSGTNPCPVAMSAIDPNACCGHSAAVLVDGSVGSRMTKYGATFRATGCCNSVPDSSLWKTQADTTVFAAMFNHCELAKDHSNADWLAHSQFCGCDLPPTSCTQQTAFILE